MAEKIWGVGRWGMQLGRAELGGMGPVCIECVKTLESWGGVGWDGVVLSWMYEELKIILV